MSKRSFNIQQIIFSVHNSSDREYSSSSAFASKTFFQKKMKVYLFGVFLVLILVSSFVCGDVENEEDKELQPRFFFRVSGLR